MNVLLLAAGFGTRLRPITNSLPKCLVHVGGRPLLSYWLDTLLESKYVDNILINTHYLEKQVYDFVMQNNKYRNIINLVYEEYLLGTAGTILYNESFFDSKEFCVIHADNFSIFDFNAFYESHIKRPDNCIMTMLTYFTDDPISCGTLTLNNKGIVIRMDEKTSKTNHLANGAVYIFENNIFDIIKSFNSNISDLSTELISKLMGQINTYHNSLYHKDIGTPKALFEVNNDIIMYNKFFNKFYD